MEKNQSTLTCCIMCGLLTAFGIIATAISLLRGSEGIWFLGDCVQILLYILITYYAFVGYKKPHGNLLKYIILMYAALFLMGILAVAPTANAVITVLYAVQVGLLCYIAGRLAKVKENIILIIIAIIGFAATVASEIIIGIADIGAVSGLVVWLDICVAYFLRYKEHRKAGLTDAPKK